MYSEQQSPEQEQTAPTDGVSLRRLIRMASTMIGRSTETERLEKTTAAEDLEPEFDTAETSLPDVGGTVENDQRPFRAGHPTGFTIQRPVISSSTPAGFFENEKAQLLLWEMMEEANFTAGPHVTIAQNALTRQIMARRQEVPLTMITSECRQVVAKLPPKKYAHITGAKTIGTNAVMLDLDWEGRGRLLQDVRHICEHYEIPFDAEHKADYYPHVTVLRAPSKEKAVEMAGRLDELITNTEPKPAAIGFGDPVPLLGRS